ncbi:hypothetical protein CL634_10855 [bacterium]|nr:hypothetical protein [bacterium]|tara:strand:- start:1900 stop:2808 length:909 start_codon:yes stop_codon:yes gene_type:complete
MPNKKRNYSYTEVENPLDVREEIPFQASTLENIDAAFYDWVNDELNVSTETNGGFKKVPVIWVSAERAYQIKRDKGLRDQDGTIVLPLITIERASVTKSLSKKGTVFANIPPVGDEKGGSITIARQINQEKTSNFANANSSRRIGAISGAKVGHGQINFPKKNKKVVYETITIPIPVYLDIAFTISLRTEYQQQMNEMLAPFLVRTGGINYFLFGKNGHRYEAFIQEEYNQENNIAGMEEEERQYQTKITVKALGYIIGGDKNEDQPKIVKRQNAVEFKLGREKVIMGDIPEHIDKRGFYRD